MTDEAGEAARETDEAAEELREARTPGEENGPETGRARGARRQSLASW